MSAIHAPSKPRLDLRVLLFPVLASLLLVLLFLRLWYIQVVVAPQLRERADAGRITEVKELAPRGRILDRNGLLVAGIHPEIVITAKPADVAKDPTVIDRVARILVTDPAKLRKKLKDASWRPYLPATIFVGASIENATRIAESADDLPGIGVESLPMRYYPDAGALSHVLGYVWSPNEKDIGQIESQGKDPADYVGKSGVEKAYEADLMGVPGAERMEIDARRRPVRLAERDASMPGNTLTLTLDSQLQKYATQVLTDHGYNGAVVALDPKSGEVLCLVSAPAFDPNQFSRGISDAEWQKLAQDENKPLLNRATYSAYAPGSTFKLVTSIAAWESGKFNPDQTFFCAGGVQMGRSFFKCLGHHGSIQFHDALVKSCNSYFYQLGHEVGEDPIRNAATEVGLGERTGIEIGGDGKGVIPTREWVAKNRKGATWYGGDTLNLAIGQGFVSTTPLQMADLVALVANSGVGYRPHLVKIVRDPKGDLVRAYYPEVSHTVHASPAFWGDLKSAMVDVVQRGTAQAAIIPGVTWAAKTGSAEHGHGLKTHSWFVGFAPAENPRIAICVLVEAAGHGGEISAPIAREIVKRYLDSLAAPANSVATASVAASRVRSPASR